MREIIYNRTKAADYAKKWALKRNPAYYNFNAQGGDCANFASQCIYAGAGIMNYRPLYGWYYKNSNDRTPSWSGVNYLYNFLTSNKNEGPYATQTNIINIQPGDIIQIAIYKDTFHHTMVVLQTGTVPAPHNILIACHTYDSINRPLDTYSYTKIRFLHINGVRSN